MEKLHEKMQFLCLLQFLFCAPPPPPITSFLTFSTSYIFDYIYLYDYTWRPPPPLKNNIILNYIVFI